MAPPTLVLRDGAQPSVVYREPLGGTIISIILSLSSITILSVFLTQRSLAIKVWRRLPYVVWLVFAIYVDSFLFIFATAILQFGFGVDSALSVCEAAILLCLVCYVTTKVFIYLFLVEKVYIIRGGTKPRMQSRLYLFNSFGMIGIYIVVAILNFVFRFTRMENGQCIIGMRKESMIPLISFDALVNIYLTVLFFIPLAGLYSFKNLQRTPANIRLRTIAIRTFIGSLCTLASSFVNLTVLMALNGEPGWVCLMCCNSDILFSAIVIQWITSKDNAASGSSADHSVYALDGTTTLTTANHDRDRPLPVPHHSSSAAIAASAARNASPQPPPSTKHVMEDVAEMARDDVTSDELRRAGSTASSCFGEAGDKDVVNLHLAVLGRGFGQ